MQTSLTQPLGFVVVAIAITHVFACSDIKIFLASCSIKDSGTSITKEQAVDVQSEFLKREGLEAIANEAVEYFDFDLQAFDGICELPINEACSTLDCGCNEASTDDSENIRAEPKLSASSAKCFPEFGCHITTTAEAEVQLADPGSVGETVMVFCFGDNCKGFSLFSLALQQTASKECGMESSDCAAIDLPPCEAGIQTKCCGRQLRGCFCRSCSSRVWRRTTIVSTGSPAFSNGDGKTCSCT